MDLRPSLRWLTIVVLAVGCGAGPVGSPAVSTGAAAPALTAPAAEASASAPFASTEPALGYRVVACALPEPDGGRPSNYIRSCGILGVPENRSRPGSRIIQLSVVTVASKDPEPPGDPILYMVNGIGGGTILPNLDGPTLESLRSHHDVVLVDGRGDGTSLPSLDCFEAIKSAIDGLTRDREAGAALGLASLTSCRDRLVAAGTDLSGYNSVEIAADMADLRIALGYDSWNLYGVSYGTLEELEVMRSHPAGIRSVVLDSVKPPDVDTLAEWGPNGDAALEILFAGCAADAACAAAHPNLGATFDRLVGELDAAPLTLEFEDPWAATIRTGSANGDTLIFSVYNALYDTAGIGALPGRIEAISAGDTELLESTLAVDANAFGAEAVRSSVYCRDDFVWTDPDKIRASSHTIQRARIAEVFTFWALWDLEACRVFGTARGDPAARGPVTSTIPTLILSGEYDPITPTAWGERALRTLKNGAIVVFPGVGHGVLGSNSCAEGLVNGFLDDPAGSVDPGCAANLDWPSFR
jgi:pimeloyl-ACP methyl ester carboxylesterase